MDISNNSLSAFMANKSTVQEDRMIYQEMANNEDFSDLVDLLNDVEAIDGMEEMKNDFYKSLNIGTMGHNDDSILPMMAMAAKNAIDSQCVIRCEGIALRHFGIDITDDELLKESEQEGYLTSEGTALHNIGRLAGARGLNVSHRYHCNIDDIQEKLSAENIVIAAVDGNELLGDYFKEQKKDKQIGLTPNHVVIVNAITDETVTITDSATPQKQDTYPLSQFLDAWNDSSCYLTIISNNEEYIPHPINLDDVEVEDELIELREAIAENTHEVWAESRKNEGWTYGHVRDDAKKQNPDMLPYNRLPESEKEYDRIMAMNTIKLVKKLGWELTKKK